MINKVPLTSSILVILYNKKPADSSTLRSLAKYKFNNCSLTVVNNGPKRFDDNDILINEISRKFIQTNIEEYLENKPLSFVYNDFIAKHVDSDRFVLLDDDTTLTESFVLKINSNIWDVDLELPLITSPIDKEVYYPLVNNIPISAFGVLPSDSTFSIGSGLIINKSLVNKFRKSNIDLFDNHFALYGVDFSFFRRINKITKLSRISITSSTKLYHSLSRITGDPSRARLKERLYDQVLSARHYPSIKNSRPVVRDLVTYTLKSDFELVLLIIKTFVTGYHPRSKVVIGK